MPNRVSVIFEGDPNHLFRTADQVEERLKKIQPGPVVAPVIPATIITAVTNVQKQATIVTQQEADKRVAIEKNAASQIVDTAKKTAAEVAKHTPTIVNRDPFRPMQGPIQVPLPKPDPYAGVELRSQSDVESEKRFLSEKRRQRESVKNDEEVANTRRHIQQKREAEEKASEERRAANFKASEDKRLSAQQGVDQNSIRYKVAYNIAYNRLRRQRIAEEEAETEKLRQEAEKRNGIRNREGRRTPGLSSGISQVSQALGLGGIGVGAASGAAGLGLAAAAAITFGKNSVESFEKANQSNQKLRASIDGLGLDYQKVSRDARTFADKHVQDITTINTKYAEFVKLARLTGEEVDSVGKKAIDVGARRALSDEQLVQGLANVRQGIADETVLGAAASTVLQTYADAHGVAVSQLTEHQKKLAVFNELQRQGSLATGEHEKRITSSTTATTKLANAWETVNQKFGQYIENFLNNPGATIAMGSWNPAANFNGPNTQPKVNLEDTFAQQRALAADWAKNQNMLDKAAASGGPLQTVTDLALKKFVDRKKFMSADQGERDTALAKAMEMAREEVGFIVKGYQQGFKMAERSIPQTQQQLRELMKVKGLIDPTEYQTLVDTAGRNLNAGFQRMIQDAKTNVPRLKEIFNQMVRSIGLTPAARDDLARSISDAIKQSIEQAKAKVKELRQAITGVMDGLQARASEGNPILEFLNAADKRMRELLENTKGFSAGFREALIRTEQDLNKRDFGKIKLQAELDAADLKRQANEFRKGFRDGGFSSNQQRFQQEFAERQRAERAADSRFGRAREDATEFQRGQREAFIADELQKNRDLETQKTIDDFLRTVKGGQRSAEEGAQWFKTEASAGARTEPLKQLDTAINKHVDAMLILPNAPMPIFEKLDRAVQARTDEILKAPNFIPETKKPIVRTPDTIIDPKPLERIDDQRHRDLGFPASWRFPEPKLRPGASDEGMTPWAGFNFFPGPGYIPEKKKEDPSDLATRDLQVIQRSSQVDPRSLRPDQRKEFVEALDREAGRKVSVDVNAAKARTEIIKYGKQAAEELAKLNSLAETGGLDAIVKVVDESDLSNTTRTANPGDTKGRRNR